MRVQLTAVQRGASRSASAAHAFANGYERHQNEKVPAQGSYSRQKIGDWRPYRVFTRNKNLQMTKSLTEPQPQKV
jgi:hypothetical protein